MDGGRTANAGRFFQCGVDALALLDELTDVPVAWRISELRLGSAVAVIAPPLDNPDQSRWLRLVAGSLGDVEEGRSLPDDFTPDAVRAAHRLVEHGSEDEEEPDWTPPRLRLVTDVPGEERVVDLTPELSGRLAALQPFERTMPGSVRGILVGVNVSRGNRASLKLPSKRVVRVAFDVALRDQLKEAMYQSVELSGTVRQDDDGRVFHVKADAARLLSRPTMKWSDLFGIDPDYTEGVPADEWLEATRGQA